MKLHELGAQRQTEQIAKALHKQYETNIDFDRLSEGQARKMLSKVRGLLREHKSSVSRHFAERNPDYMKLVMLEQALSQHVPVAPSREIVVENDIQQAQVVLAAQDLVDRLQSMMEDVSEMQFKDLPALTDSIRNDVGTEQASQFSSQANTALANLLAAVQAAKAEMEAAQGVLTGEAAITVPGEEPAAELGAEPTVDDLAAELPVPGEEEEEEEEIDATAELGRERR